MADQDLLQQLSSCSKDEIPALLACPDVASPALDEPLWAAPDNLDLESLSHTTLVDFLTKAPSSSVVTWQAAWILLNTPSAVAIKDFLSSVAQHWMDQDKKRLKPLTTPPGRARRDETCPRDWLLRGFERLLDKSDSSSAIWWLDWASRVHLHLRQALHSKLVECQPPRLSTWLAIVATLKDRLSTKDGQRVRQTTEESLSFSASEELPLLAQLVIDVGQTQPASWISIPRQVLDLASRDLAILHATETRLVETFEIMVASQWQGWDKALRSSDESADSDVRLRLLWFRAGQKSSMVQSHVAVALGTKSMADQWPSLVTLLVPSFASAEPRQLLNALQELVYLGNGYFGKQGRPVDAVSKVGASVYQNLFPAGRELTLEDRAQAKGRGQAWLDLITTGMQQKCPEQDVVLSVVALVIVYAEVPALRAAVVDTMCTALRRSQRSDTRINSIFLTVLSILASWKAQEDALHELEKLLDVLRRPVSLEVFCSIGKVLSTRKNARSSLCDIASEAVTMAFADFCKSLDKSGGDLLAFEERQQCGLFTLSILVAGDTWEDLELRAWSLLSEVIVESRPPLSVTMRSWLFQTLTAAVKRGTISACACRHLLRGSLCRLLYFFGSTADGSQIFVLEKAFSKWSESSSARAKRIEDVVGLVNLVLTLAYSLANQVNQRTFRDGRDGFKRVVAGEAVSLTMPILVSENDEGLLVKVSLYFIALVGRTLVVNDSIVGPQSLLVDDVQLMVETQERADLTDMDPLPGWLRPKPNVIDRSIPQATPMRTVDCVSKLAPALCDVLLKYLVGADWIKLCDDDTESQTVRRLLSSGVCNLLEARRHSSADEEYTLMDPSILGDVVESFFAFSIPNIERVITANGDFEVVEVMLAAILDLCDELDAYAVASKLTLIDIRRLGRLVWSVYLTLFEETAAVRLIAYLQRARTIPIERDGETRPATSASPSRIGNIETIEDIDESFRNMRARSLCAVLACLLSPPPSSLCDRLVALEDQTASSADEEEAYVLALLSCIQVIVHDAKTGVTGASGGLTVDLCLLFVDCIDASVFNLLPIVENLTSAALLLRIWRGSRTASNVLQSVVCTEAIDDAKLFKKVLNACLATLPALARSTERRLLAVDDNLSRLERLVAQQDDFVARALRQCVAILSRMAVSIAQGKEIDSAWPLVAGQEHVRAVMRLKVQNGDGDLEDVVGGGGASRADTEQSVDTGDQVLQLGSERVWRWAVGHILQSIEWQWDESLNVIKTDKPHAIPDECARLYVAKRSMELSRHSLAVAILFQPLGTQDSAAESTAVLVTHLPPTTKSRLVDLLDRMLIALLKSSKTLLATLRDATTIDYIPPVVEAVSCMLSWLSVDKTDGECLSWIQKWQESENVTKAGDSANVLAKLRITLVRVNDLDSLLRQIADELDDNPTTKRKGKPKRDTREVIKNLDSLVRSVDVSSQLSTFRAIVRSKVAILDQVRTKQSADELQASRQKAADVHNQVRKKRRKVALRSRNQLVDKFLRLDATTGPDEPLDDDDYADLEDMLVDG